MPYASTSITRDPYDTRRAALRDAILHRSNAARYPLTEPARAYTGRTLLGMARAALEAQGVRVEGLDRMQVAERAFHGSSDFPAILADVANKTLRDAYQAAGRTFTAWCKQSFAPDFKEVLRGQLGDAPALQKVNQNGEFTYGAITDYGENYQLATYGRIVAITRQALVNDDLNAFARLIPGFGAQAAGLESDIVYGVLTGNPAMADGVNLFDADHGNLADPGGDIDVEELGKARAAMRKQVSSEGAYLSISPAFLIVPAVLETAAQQFTSTAHMPDASSNVNPFAGSLQTVAEPRLDAASASAWYLAADPGLIDTIEYAYLEGTEGVQIETRQGWNVDGVEFKARLDFAAKAIDWRGLYRNPGE